MGQTAQGLGQKHQCQYRFKHTKRKQSPLCVGADPILTSWWSILDRRQQAGVSHEFLSDKANVNTTFMNQSLQVQSGSIGRYRANIGVSISGDVSKSTSISIGLFTQFASNWNATAGLASLKIEF